MKHTFHILRALSALVVAALLLTGCASRRKAAKAASAATQTTVIAGQTTVGQTPAAKPSQQKTPNPWGIDALTARINFGLESSDPHDKMRVKVGGTLRMKRDDVIQLSLVALGIMEVARIEITPEYILLVDKMGQQYMQTAYADMPALSQAGVNFQTLQAYFWGESTVQSGGAFKWEYLDYTKLGERDFPSSMRFAISASKTISGTLTLSDIKADANWETRTTLNKNSYTKVSPEQLISRILSLTK